jgi:hypothetical protein
MTKPLTIECEVHFDRRCKGRKALATGTKPPKLEPGRVPRIARLMALAIRFEKLIADGVVADYADLARLGHVSRARVSQIANLTLLAPDIQSEILFLPKTERGKERLSLRILQPIALEADWGKQRRMWRELVKRARAMKE